MRLKDGLLLPAPGLRWDVVKHVLVPHSTVHPKAKFQQTNATRHVLACDGTRQITQLRRQIIGRGSISEAKVGSEMRHNLARSSSFLRGGMKDLTANRSGMTGAWLLHALDRIVQSITGAMYLALRASPRIARRSSEGFKKKYH